MEENNILCKFYNKRYCLPVYSGTLAIEGLLKSLKLKNTDKVLISSISCYSILEAILNAGLTPIIATPKNGILFTIEELKKIVKQEKIKVYIAVHQYGYYQELPKINNLIVIEDLSQTWNLKKKDGTKIEYYGDYLIQSLGSSKPLSNSIGGLILSDIDISENFDLKTKKSRMTKSKLLEYYYPLKINYKKIIAKANKKIFNQRYNAKKFNLIFAGKKSIDIFSNDNYSSCYHRYVIKVNRSIVNQLINIFEKAKINYELEYKLKLSDLPIINEYKIKTLNNYSSGEDIMILLKTNNSLFNINKLKKEMEKFYEG